MRSNRLNTYLPSLSEASSGVSQDLEEGESTESDNRHKCSEPFHLTVLPASDGVKAPKVEECDKESENVVTPTSILSLEDGSTGANSHLNNTSIDALAVQRCQDAELKAHALCSFGSDASEESLPNIAVTHQECRSHAINVHSKECSSSSAVLRADEMIASWTDRLIMQTKPVGKGTFGTVYTARLARDASAMYPMAIKKLQCHTRHEYRVIRHEADLMQAMSKAGLECIPQLYESCWNREEDAAYLVMQRIPGVTLDEFIAVQHQSEGTATSLDKPALLRQHAAALVRAVHELHSHGFVHADLKNSNAIAADVDGKLVIYLVDMACSQQQKTGQRKVRGGGTLHHMAPELVGNYLQKAAGNPAVPQDGFPCDMWALGVMLAELLTGKLPFWPKTGFDYAGMGRLLANWALAVDGRRTSKTLQQLQHMSPAAFDLVTRMLRVKPARRITAAEAVQHAYIHSW